MVGIIQGIAMNVFKKIKRRVLGYTANEMIKELTDGGAIIGKGVVFFDINATVIDKTRPWLLSIGEYTKITRGCVILTHDYSLSVLRRKYGEWIGEGAETIIGKNCFIGMNSIILMGTQIGDNVIVGAGSVVHGIIPDNVVIGGNPARVICTLDEYHRRRTERTVNEAKRCAKVYYQRFGRFPTPECMSRWKFILFQRDNEFLDKNNISFMCSGDEPNEVENMFYSTEPLWNSYDEFLNTIKEEIKHDAEFIL